MFKSQDETFISVAVAGEDMYKVSIATPISIIPPHDEHFLLIIEEIGWMTFCRAFLKYLAPVRYPTFTKIAREVADILTCD